jgi:beta-galactosidase
LEIRVDNRPDADLIPSDLSDFFLYGGLTRNAWLYQTGAARIQSVRVETEIDGDRAHVRLTVRMDGDVPLGAEVHSPDGELVAAATARGRVIDLGELRQPQLWSPERPALYEARVRAGDSDQVSLRFGLRRFDFPEGGVFHVNGQPVKLWGTHRHEDWAGLASAVPDRLTRQELDLVRRAGFNFIRLGHYPQAPAVLDACDELGLVVWEELPWCRGGVGGEAFRARARSMLEEMIEQHQHHPSIAFWGLGNELDWEVSEHPGSSQERVVEFLAELHDLAHRLDSGRLTALRRFEPGAGVVDVYSPSIWSGWYRGRYEDYAQALADLPSYRRLLHIEWGADSQVGRHGQGAHLPTPPPSGTDHGERPGDALTAEGPARASRDGDWSESYALALMEWHLQVQMASPGLAGAAQWAFKDFGTPLRPENPIPYVNQKGLVDRAGRPKDAYYLFSSYLSREPVCYVESPTWPIRVGAPDDIQHVRVYSNCDQVELILDGASLGWRRRDPTSFPAAGLVWEVPFVVGRHQLRAVGRTVAGGDIEHAIEQDWRQGPAGEPAGLFPSLQAGSTADGLPALTVTVQLEDAAGIPVVEDRRRVRFELLGGGRICGCRGTVDGSSVGELANGRAVIHVLEPAPQGSALLVSAEGLEPLRILVR